MAARPIYMGIIWTYTNREDGRRLRDLFRKVAFFDKTLGATAGLLELAGIATESLATVLGGLGAGAGTEIGERFEKGADLVNEHPDSGRIYMYPDHVIYRKYH